MRNNNKIPSVKILYSKISKNRLQNNSIQTDELWYSRIFGRHISIYFTWVMLKLDLTPNQATLIAFIFGIVGLLLLSVSNFFLFLLGFICFHLYIIIDSSDGEMARYLNMKSEMGAFYDKLLHYIMKIGILVVISIQIFNLTQNLLYIILGLITGLLSGFSSTFYHLLPRNNIISYSDQIKEDGRLIGLIRKIFRSITGDIELSIIILVIFVAKELFSFDPINLLFALLFSQFILLQLFIFQQIYITSLKA